jgi:uncharacterized protein YegL
MRSRPSSQLACTLLLATALIDRAAASGNPSCPCLTTYPTGVDPGAIQLSGKTYAYPATYGLSSCLRHDESKQPFCSNASSAPHWCGQAWCYIDVASCTLTHARSGYFPKQFLYYSYQTCGTANTFDSWFDAEAASGDPSELNKHNLVELAGVVATYVKSTATALEDNEIELRSATNLDCSTPSSCPCLKCSNGSDASAVFGNQSITLGSTTYTTRAGAATTPDTPAAKKDVCLAGIVGEAFMRVAAAEARPDQRLGYLYGGLQDLGTYMQWPGVQWCTKTYDPRFRPWYAAAASGPKDVIIVIDQSGSMRSQQRMDLAIAAGKKVIDTLTEADFATVIAFSSNANAASSKLLQATEANKKTLEAFIGGLKADGSTNFGAALGQALSIFEGTGAASSSCHRVILFMSDGQPTGGTWASGAIAQVKTRAAKLSPAPRILTYAFGSGADFGALKSIACDHQGVAYKIQDGGNIANVMASYYKLLSPLSSPCQVRWTQYTDWLTGQQLTAACLASYKKPSASSPTSCKEGQPGCLLELLAVTCVDMGVMASMAALKANVGWDAFWARVQAEQKQCPKLAIDDAQLQYLRANTSADGVCDAGPRPQKCVTGAGTDTSSSTGGGSALGMGAIIGIVAGSVFVLMGAAFLSWAIKKARPEPVRGHDRGFRPWSSVSTQSASSAQPTQTGIPMAQAVAVPIAGGGYGGGGGGGNCQPVAMGIPVA